jgi:uncharacterized membrane protein
MEHWMNSIAMAVDVIGVGVIVLGMAIAAVRFGLAAIRHTAESYRRFRQDLGRSILLGLEFLVAADIIHTVAVEPTLENLSVLGLIVLIRTFLSMILQLEVEGRWPWQGRPA